MLKRFSLYGFLKNQRYFEPFFILTFLEKGLSFFEIGILLGFRDVVIVVLEIPTGAIADFYGRRASLMFSLVAYIASFTLFAFTHSKPLLFAAMLLFGIGDAFRTGTHKALIFSWLRSTGRIAERTRYYGYTRSWSKIGSAVSVVVGAVLVYTSDNYSSVFYMATIPYLAGVINLMGYPTEDGQAAKRIKVSDLVRHITGVLVSAFRRRDVRRLFAESMAFGGLFQATKDYVQPAAMTAVLIAAPSLAFATHVTPRGQTAIFVASIYFLLHLLESAASRHAHLPERIGKARGVSFVWVAGVVVFSVLFISAYFELFAFLIAAFVFLHALHNIWRPIAVGRFGDLGDEQMATVLSVESQARRAASALLAPLLGLAVDTVRAGSIGGELWPIGAVGIVIMIGLVITGRTRAAVTS